MIEPLYEDDISSIIKEVRPEDVQHFDNKKFIRIRDEEMPELLKFVDESADYEFDDWAIIGETRADEDQDSPIPGSSEEPPKQSQRSEKTPPSNLFDGVDGIETREDGKQDDDEEEIKDAKEEDEATEGKHQGDEDEAEGHAQPEREDDEAELEEPREAENSLVFSMFLSNWEDQVRQIRETKRREWEQKMKELLGEDGEAKQGSAADDGGVFVDEDGDSWVLIDDEKTSNDVNAVDDGDAKAATTTTEEATNDDEKALVAQHAVVSRTAFFEEWPSFNVGPKLGGVTLALYFFRPPSFYLLRLSFPPIYRKFSIIYYLIL